MLRKTRKVLIGSVCLTGSLFSARADVTVPGIFSDHAILQRSATVPVWGSAEPGEAVTVVIGNVRATTTASAAGKWKVILDLDKAAAGPHEMAIEGKNTLHIADVLLGEVWICSGQSNMQFALRSATGAKEEIGRSANPLLRVFRLPMRASNTPLERCDGKWIPSTPATAGEFTAVGYYFGQKLQRTLGVPVGLIDNSWGGSSIESWVSPGAFDEDPILKASKDRVLEQRDTYPAKEEIYGKALNDWLTRHDRKDAGGDKSPPYAQPDLSLEGWAEVTIPGDIDLLPRKQGGVVWVRKEIEIPASAKERTLTLKTGVIRGFEDVYWNGTRIGKTTLQKPAASIRNRAYVIPKKLVQPGKNTLAIRIFAPVGDAGMTPRVVEAYAAGAKPSFLPFGIDHGPDLRGKWLARVEQIFPPLPPDALKSYPAAPPLMDSLSRVASLYNGMIAPLVPYAMRGVLWYQGEANRERGFQYRTEFPLLIKDWRRQWKRGDFPFYFCQIPNWRGKDETPQESKLAELRESQSMGLALPNTGQAVLIDSGEAYSLHPRDKKTPGERLAGIALAQTYGKKVPFSGPVYRQMVPEGNRIRIRFDHLEGGLVAGALPEEYHPRSTYSERLKLVLPSPGSQLQGFAICGKERKWVWADAKIDGASVVVGSGKVPDPVAVRYAWSDNPTCNLYNAAGLPASPFRTDDFSPITSGNLY